MEKECVSVIVPVYNAEDFLMDTSKAILDQTYENLELIFVENGSTDRTLEICENLAEADHRVKVLHIDRTGVSAARNVGIEAAQGKYIAFSDSDDFMKTNMIQTMVSAMEERKADLVICGFRHMDSVSGNEIETIYGLQHEFFNNEKYLHLDMMLRAQILHAVWNKLFQREKIMKYKIRFRESMQIGEDLTFNLDYLDTADTVFCISKPLYDHYLKRSGSITNTFRPNYYKQQKFMLDRMFESLSKVDPIQEDGKEYYELAYVDMMSAAISYLFYPQAGLKNKKAVYDEMKELRKDREYFRCAKSQWDQLSLKEKIIAQSLKNKCYGLIYPFYCWKHREKKTE